MVEPLCLAKSPGLTLIRGPSGAEVGGEQPFWLLLANNRSGLGTSVSPCQVLIIPLQQAQPWLWSWRLAQGGTVPTLTLRQADGLRQRPLLHDCNCICGVGEGEEGQAERVVATVPAINYCSIKHRISGQNLRATRNVRYSPGRLWQSCRQRHRPSSQSLVWEVSRYRTHCQRRQHSMEQSSAGSPQWSCRCTDLDLD